jgi:hypothetical protein
VNTERYFLYVVFIIGSLLVNIGIASDIAVINFQRAVSSGVADIEPSESLAIDLDGYKVSADADIIVLQVFNDYYYQSIKPDKKTYIFSRDSGQPIKGSKAFSGVNRLDSVFVIIGKEAYPGSLEMGVMDSSESISIRVGL